jgi:hypothetical protein
VRPGGTVGLVSWTGEGIVGRLLSAAGDWDPELPPALSWGVEERVRLELGLYAADVRFEHCPVEAQFVSPAAAAAALERALPPVAAALAGFPGADGNGLRDHAARLVEEEDGTTVRGRALITVARRMG